VLDPELKKSIEHLAEERMCPQSKIFEDALRLYLDKVYMEEKATVINDELLQAVKGVAQLSEAKINAKTNQVLSSLAIEVGVMNQILAQSLQVSPLAVEQYRKNVVEFLRANNRVLRMDEVVG
jgi:DNA-binding NarL/FixJ family response regulator